MCQLAGIDEGNNTELMGEQVPLALVQLWHFHGFITPEAEFMKYNFVEVSRHNLESSQT